MSSKLETLRSKKTSLLAASLTLVEGGLKTEEERTRNAAYLSQIDEVQGQIDLNEKLNRKMAQFGITATPPETQATAPAIRTEKTRTAKAERRALNHAFASYLRGRNVQAEYRDVLGSVTAGQSILPQAYSDVLQTARKIYAPFTQLATVQENVTLAGYKAAFVDDRANGLVILSADGGVSANEGDPVFASQLVNLDVTTSQEVRFSNQLAADSNFDLGQLLKTLCASRVGRGIERLVTRGQDYASSPATSTNQANLIANVTVGTTTTSLANRVQYEDIINLALQLDDAYMQDAVIMMSQKTRLGLLAQTDSAGRALWQASPSEERGMSLLGFPVVTNNSLDAVTVASGVPIILGSLKAISLGLSALRIHLLRERYADVNESAIIPSILVGSAIIDPNAMVKLKLAAS